MYRILLSCATAQRMAARIEAVGAGVQAFVVPDGADPRQVLHERGLV